MIVARERREQLAGPAHGNVFLRHVLWQSRAAEIEIHRPVAPPRRRLARELAVCEVVAHQAGVIRIAQRGARNRPHARGPPRVVTAAHVVDRDAIAECGLQPRKHGDRRGGPAVVVAEEHGLGICVRPDDGDAL